MQVPVSGLQHPSNLNTFDGHTLAINGRYKLQKTSRRGVRPGREKAKGRIFQAFDFEQGGAYGGGLRVLQAGGEPFPPGERL